MPRQDFENLFTHYPTTIRSMPRKFTSHQFILRLAHDHQTEYIEALYACRRAKRSGRAAPFMALHALLAQELGNYARLAVKVGVENNSRDIFGNSNSSTVWQRR